MMKHLISTVLSVFIVSPVFAGELTPENLVGRYKVEAKAGFQKVYANFRVVNGKEFELQRTYPNGQADEVCNGTYKLSDASLFWQGEILAKGKYFSGNFTCPSNRSRTVDFNIDFKKTSTEDLARGTSVSVTSSLAPGMRLNAYVKKN